MRTLAAIFGCGLLLLVLSDCLNTVVVPRRTPRVLPIARAFYRLSWRPVSAIARRITSGERREAFLSIYGPVSFLGLFALWIAGLIVGFGLLQWAAGMRPDRIPGTLMNDIYFSATTLITLTTGDPLNDGSKFLAVVEGGLGLCLLGMVVAYLPVLYQSFSTRERGISLLDARAGSPPSAGTLLSSATCSPGKLEQEFVEWEKWEAQIFESQLSLNAGLLPLTSFESVLANCAGGYPGYGVDPGAVRRG